MSDFDFTSLRSGGEGCPSDLALDRLESGELPASEAATASAHVRSCALCAARMRQRSWAGIPEANVGAMLQQIREGLDEPRSLAERARRWLGGLRGARGVPLALALGAAGLLLVLQPWPHHAPASVTGDGDEAVRAKGGLALHVYRLAGKDSEEVASGGRVSPGDSLRFVVDLPRAGQVTIVGVEAGGELYTAWPTASHAGESLRPAGPGQALPGAVALDDSVGRETLYLVHCAPPLQAAGAPPRCTSRGANSRPACPDGCVATPFVLDKGR